ncbi:MAG: YegP family protein [Haloarculaceae archaeon]
MRHQNGNVLADSGEGYSSRSAVTDAIESVKRDAPGAEEEHVED